MLSKESILLASKFDVKNNIPNKKLHSFYKEMYDTFCDACDYIQKLKNNKYLVSNTQIINNTNEIPKPEDFASIYFPRIIQEYIDEKTNYVVSYNLNIFDREIIIHFVLDSKKYMKKLNKYVEIMVMWLYFVNMYSLKKCSKILNVYLYFTPFKKTLPEEPLDDIEPIHVNSAYTYCCRKDSALVIFRKEEWFKVFIHETMHNFGLDFCDIQNKKIKAIMKTIFPIKSKMLMYESYCEFWATIMNSLVISFLNNTKTGNIEKDLTNFKENANHMINIERNFSLYQMSKILAQMGLSYDELYGTHEEDKLKRAYLYKESTNTFSYYVVKTIVLFYYNDFITWCQKNNIGSFITFKRTEKNIELFCKFIKDKYNKKLLNDAIKNINYTSYGKDEFVIHTTRMSLFDF